MINRCFLTWVTVILLLSNALTARAEAPSGTVEFTVTDSPILELTGGHNINARVRHADGSGVDLIVPVDIIHRPDGRLRGSGLTLITLGDTVLLGEYVVTGRTLRFGGSARVEMTVRVAGDADIGGAVRSYGFTVRVRGRADFETGEIVGIAVTQGGFSGLGRIQGRAGNFTWDLPDAMDGSWDLSIYVVPGLRPLAGDATMRLSNGRTLDFNLRGNYLPQFDETVLRLRNPGAGFNVLLDGELSIIRMRGAVFGQRVR